MKQFLKSALRNFIRKPATNLINFMGLSISLALVIVLAVYCYSELTTDHFHKNIDRVYLCTMSDEYYHSSVLLKDQVDQSIHAVELAVRVGCTGEPSPFRVSDKDLVNSDMLFADDGFFDLFTYQTVAGNPELALKEPLTLVVTKAFAEKLFGTADAVGKTVKFNNDKLFTVAAVVEKPQGNSMFSFNAVTSVSTKRIIFPNPEEFSRWGWTSVLTFMRLKSGARPEEISKNILSVIPETERKMYEGGKLIPFTKLYFSDFYTYFLHLGNKRKVMVLLVVSALILVIALVNFINISSSQWLEKIRQTGVKKVLGARRSAIVLDILSGSFLFFLAALLFAVTLAFVAMPFIRHYTGIGFDRGLLLSPSFWMISVASVFVLSALFSLLPALRISSSKAVDNLKKTSGGHASGSKVRGILVAGQFAIAIVLIAFTVLVQKQVHFGSSSLGVNQENIIGIKLSAQLQDKKDVLKKILEEKPGIGEIAFTQYYPAGKALNHLVTIKETEQGRTHFDFYTFCADAEFFKIMGLQLKEGRFYSGDLSTDEGKVLVNETFVREHKMDKPVGEKIDALGGESEIVGVLKDFHYESLNVPIGSLVIQNEKEASYCLVQLQTSDFSSLHRIVGDISSEMAKLSPSFPVEVSFFDQAVENMYQSELQFRRAFTLFSGSAIMICCMGILAMSLFACQRRIKEIGIRKVNGARISEVMTMLNKDFVKWVAIAFVVACPIAYFTMNKWLENFAYKTTLNWWIFALAGVLALGIALLTVSWQSWKAATRNPVEALRYE